ncbi:uncharacterized protein DMAD_02481 [Drosophila madeirensis]|uniref:Pre-C2HC domain-containing protein n=2 Tax=Drosophila madeirensis TaxID=30013 RepID=A0AAU9G6L6_DROMD
MPSTSAAAAALRMPPPAAPANPILSSSAKTMRQKTLTELLKEQQAKNAVELQLSAKLRAERDARKGKRSAIQGSTIAKPTAKMAASIISKATYRTRSKTNAADTPTSRNFFEILSDNESMAVDDCSVGESELELPVPDNRPSSDTRSAPVPNNSSVQNATSADAKIVRPVPIYIPNVREIVPLLQGIDAAIGVGLYDTNPTANGCLKVTCHTIDGHRKLVQMLSAKDSDGQGVDFHTFRLRSDKGLRVVIRHLHRSTPTAWVCEQLKAMGHVVRHISNIYKRFTKEPLDLFEVELEPKANNQSIFEVTAICSQQVKIEKPIRSPGVPQCHKCQMFGHTKNYCSRAVICVKCGDKHEPKDCPKEREETPKCANCGGAHVANYRGCTKFKEYCKKRESGLVKTTNMLSKLNLPTLPAAVGLRRPRVPPNMNQKGFPELQQSSRRRARSGARGPAPPGLQGSYASAVRCGQPQSSTQPLPVRQQVWQNATTYADVLAAEAVSRPGLGSQSVHSSDLSRKLDTLISLLTQERVQPAVAEATQRLENKMDQLVEQMTRLTECLLATIQANTLARNV